MMQARRVHGTEGSDSEVSPPDTGYADNEEDAESVAEGENSEEERVNAAETDDASEMDAETKARFKRLIVVMPGLSLET